VQLKPTRYVPVPPTFSHCALVVDDEASVRSVLRRYLLRRGWAVLEASNGDEALELIADGSELIDAVVVDLHLPGLSGSALCRRISALRPMLASRIIMASGDALGAVEELAKEAFTCRILAKPFDLKEFVRMLDEVVAA